MKATPSQLSFKTSPQIQVARCSEAASPSSRRLHRSHNFGVPSIVLPPKLLPRCWLIQVSDIFPRPQRTLPFGILALTMLDLSAPSPIQPVAKPPIVFKLPGMKPEICLNVLGQEYYADSILLKVRSGFFRTFLDSADKETSVVLATEAKSTRKFRYEWVTKVDEDGSWQLISAPTAHEVR